MGDEQEGCSCKSGILRENDEEEEEGAGALGGTFWMFVLLI